MVKLATLYYFIALKANVFQRDRVVKNLDFYSFECFIVYNEKLSFSSDLM